MSEGSVLTGSRMRIVCCQNDIVAVSDAEDNDCWVLSLVCRAWACVYCVAEGDELLILPVDVSLSPFQRTKCYTHLLKAC